MSPRRKEENLRIQELSRANILKVSFSLFARFGYTQTSISRIAAKAKISKGLIYHYFRSKPDILKGIFYNLMEEADELLQLARNLPAGEYLRELIRFSVRYCTAKPEFCRLSIALTVQPKVIRGLEKEIEQIRKQWFPIFERVFRELGYSDPLTEAILLASTLDGMNLNYITDRDYPIQQIEKLLLYKYGL